jgi:hypothetical protein
MKYDPSYLHTSISAAIGAACGIAVVIMILAPWKHSSPAATENSQYSIKAEGPLIYRTNNSTGEVLMSFVHQGRVTRHIMHEAGPAWTPPASDVVQTQ